jgi:hypothetical protein
VVLAALASIKARTFFHNHRGSRLIADAIISLTRADASSPKHSPVVNGDKKAV